MYYSAVFTSGHLSTFSSLVVSDYYPLSLVTRYNTLLVVGTSQRHKIHPPVKYTCNRKKTFRGKDSGFAV